MTQWPPRHSACWFATAQPRGGQLAGGLAVQSARKRASEDLFAGCHWQPGQHTSEPGIPGMIASQSAFVAQVSSSGGRP
jgi:hypothetical protein